MFTVGKQAPDKLAVTNKAAQTVCKQKTKPKILNLIKYVLLVVFIILLVAQLRAIELSDAIYPALRPNATNHEDQDVTIRQNSSSQNQTLSFAIGGIKPHQSLRSIDRHDQDWPVGQQESKTNISGAGSLVSSNASSLIENKQTVKSEQVEERQAVADLFAAPTANVAQIQNASPNEALTNQFQQTAPIGGEPLLENQIPLEELDSSLAELTAAGTAAGLVVHDLLTQANLHQQNIDSRPSEPMLLNSHSIETPFPSATKIDANDDDEDSDMLARQQQEKQLHQRAYNSFQPANNNEQAEEEENDSQLLDNNSQKLASENKDGRRQEQLNRAAANLIEADPEPPSQEQMPDSMDSLMRSEGENINTGHDEGPAGDQQQLMAGANLVSQNEQLGGINGQMPPDQFVKLPEQLAAAGLSADESDDDDNDGDERDSNNKIGQDSRPLLNHLARLGNPDGSDMTSLQLQDATQLLGDQSSVIEVGRHPHHLENNLVAPMRDSLSDLNTAAGHYHNKKKKKKRAKKVVYTKKKKYIKRKKVKVIKMVHKKKKKKPIKMKKKHDNGKYYMYAKVPKKKAWEFGFKKGNKKHWIERHEKGYKNKFKTKVKWYDKKSKGKGVHIWDYNHHDKKKKNHY